MSRLLALVIVNFLLAILLAASAFAGTITVLTGTSHFSKAGDGIWYQEPFPYSTKLTSVSVGVRYDSDSYSVGYMNLGNTSVTSVAVGVDAPGDGGYSSVTKSCVNGCMPTSHWYGAGNVQGVYVSALKPLGKWTLEAGAYLYRPTWSVNIPDWRGCRECSPSQLTATHNPRLQLGPMLGVRYKIDQWSINASWWRTQVSGDLMVPIFDSDTYNLSLGYSF